MSAVETHPQGGTNGRRAGANRWRLLSFVFLSVVMPLSVGCTLDGTPRRSLSELRAALLNRDADKALRYVDLESVVDCAVRDIFLKYETNADNPLGVLAARAGREAAKPLMPGLKALVRKQIRTAITSSDQWGYFDDIRRASVWYLNVTVEGDTAVVESKGKGDVRFKMARAGEGHWRIVEIARK